MRDDRKIADAGGFHADRLILAGESLYDLNKDITRIQSLKNSDSYGKSYEQTPAYPPQGNCRQVQDPPRRRSGLAACRRLHSCGEAGHVRSSRAGNIERAPPAFRSGHGPATETA